MDPTVAVIISTYNEPEYLARVLDGYSAQSRLADELLVADDGSDRCTVEAVSDFASRARFPIRRVYQQDLGFRAARIRNEAVKASSSEYLIFTDGDCVPHRRFIEDHTRIMRAGCFIQGKRMLVSKRTSARFTHAGSWQLLKMCLKGEISGCHHLVRVPGLTIRNRGLRGIKSCNLAVHRKDFLAVNGFNEDFVGWGREDSELAVRLLKHGLTRRDAPFSAIVFHLWHEGHSREALSRNDALLAKTIQSSDFCCANGIVKRTT